MKDRTLFFILIIFAINLLSFSVFANSEPQNENGLYPTGLSPLSEEEIEWVKENVSRTEFVQPNEIGLSRINETRKEKGLSELNNNICVELGKEIITNKNVGELDYAELVSDINQQVVSEDLPSSINNMTNEITSKYFPPLDWQRGNSCGAFSGTYFQMTYMNALVHNYDVHSDPSKILSPRFTHNICNMGVDAGSWPFQNFEVAKKFGCASYSEFYYGNEDFSYQHVMELPTDSNVWRNALNTRVKEYGLTCFNENAEENATPVTNIHSEALNLAKEFLNNGYVISFATYINSWKWKSEYNNSNISVCYASYGADGMHAMTVVGYDDSIAVDINGNGLIEDGEKGAFKIVNSWGSDWNGDGTCWMSYDALNKISSVPNAPEFNAPRSLGWLDYKFYWVNMCKDYTPILTAEFKIKTANRGKLNISLGTSDLNKNIPDESTKVTYFPALADRPLGNLAFDGTTNYSEANIVLDFSDLIFLNESSERRWYLNIDNYTNDMWELLGFKIKDEQINREYESNNSFPLMYGNKTVWADATLPLYKVLDDKIWILNFSEKVLPDTILNNGITIKDMNNNIIPTFIDFNPIINPKKVLINPPNDRYKSNERYLLQITDNVKSMGGNALCGVDHCYFKVK